MPPGPLTREDYQGLAEIAKARRSLLVNMFTGTRLHFGTKDKLSTSKDLLSSGKSVASSAKKLASAGKSAASSSPGALHQMAENFLSTCADVEGIHEVVAAISSEAVTHLVSEMTPFVGVVTSSVKLLQAGKVVVEDGYNLYKSREYKTGFLRGDPLAAAEAVQTIIQRDLTEHSIDLGRQTTATGIKIAGLFADLGTATTAAAGLANSVAALGLKLYRLGRDITDMRAGNKHLATPDNLNLTVFEDCPILGCYLLTCADTSLVANFFVADIGLPGWMDRVELLKKTKMDPLLKIATKDINKSPLQLEGLRGDKGTHMKKGFFANLKSKAVNRINPFAKSKPVPTVDKSRIVGMGSQSRT